MMSKQVPQLAQISDYNLEKLRFLLAKVCERMVDGKAAKHEFACLVGLSLQSPYSNMRLIEKKIRSTIQLIDKLKVEYQTNYPKPWLCEMYALFADAVDSKSISVSTGKLYVYAHLGHDMTARTRKQFRAQLWRIICSFKEEE